MNLNPIYIFELAKSNEDIYELIIGKEVEHKVFGYGIVTRVEKNTSNRKYNYIYIKFDEEKKFGEDVHKYLSKIKLDEDTYNYIKCKINDDNRDRYIKNNLNNKKQINTISITKRKANLNEFVMNLTKIISDIPSRNDNSIDNLSYRDKSIKDFESIYSIENEEKQEIKKFIQDNNITEIIHFTQLDNLESIMEKGLLSNDILKKNNIKFIRNDYNRFDNLENTICLSIGFPNYKMFYKLRYEDKLKKWVVLIIKPEILYEKTCVFCNGNAASQKINSVSIAQRTGSRAFKNLFYRFVDNNSGMTRDDLKILKKHTTNPQAEVLVFNKIEPSYIKGIVFCNEDRELCKEYTGKYVGVKVVSNNYYYKARNDYKFWGGNYGETTSVCSK